MSSPQDAGVHGLHIFNHQDEQLFAETQHELVLKKKIHARDKTNKNTYR